MLTCSADGVSRAIAPAHEEASAEVAAPESAPESTEVAAESAAEEKHENGTAETEKPVAEAEAEEKPAAPEGTSFAAVMSSTC